MKKRYQYILFALILLIVYMLYLIISFKYVDIQKDNTIDSMQKEIAQRKEELEKKKTYFDYVNSFAYKDKILKSSQNKKNPGEDVYFIVTKEDIDQYKKIDIEKQINEQIEPKGPTYNMTNWQKWIYYIFRKDLSE